MTAILTPLTVAGNAYQAQSLVPPQPANSADKAAFDAAMAADLPAVEVHAARATTDYKTASLSSMPPEIREQFKKTLHRYIVDLAIDYATNPIYQYGNEDNDWA
ncbi:hypothetical protein [Imbroritus primus]|uniref:hypothetical protein n=1 Tax=Imbroritus primus TaxID=3058603 RepID=UPI003D161EB9